MSTGEIPLARLWHLPDGTCCLLLKDPRAEHWLLRVARGDHMLRSEHYSSVIVAMQQGKQWRALFDASLEPAVPPRAPSPRQL